MSEQYKRLREQQKRYNDDMKALYLAMQDELAEENGIREGSHVRVNHSAEDYALGWDNTWSSDAFGAISTYQVEGMSDKGVKLFGLPCSLPFYVLGVVDEDQCIGNRSS